MVLKVILLCNSTKKL